MESEENGCHWGICVSTFQVSCAQSSRSVCEATWNYHDVVVEETKELCFYAAGTATTPSCSSCVGGSRSPGEVGGWARLLCCGGHQVISCSLSGGEKCTGLSSRVTHSARDMNSSCRPYVENELFLVCERRHFHRVKSCGALPHGSCHDASVSPMVSSLVGHS